MAIPITGKPNTDAPDSNYSYGNIRDNPGNNTGTPVNKLVYADFHQFFARMFAGSGLTYNNLPDNDTNGYQYFDALIQNIHAFKSEIAHIVDTTLTDDDFGKLIYKQGSSPATFTLPVSTGSNLYKKITITNSGTGSLTVVCSGSQTFLVADTVVLQTGDSFEAESNANGYTIINRYTKSTTTSPVTATNVNTWTGTIKYRMANQMVGIIGTASNIWNSGLQGATIFTLPIGFRPTSTKNLSSRYFNNTQNVYNDCTITIDTSGAVKFYTATGVTLSDSIFVYLDFINFYIGW